MDPTLRYLGYATDNGTYLHTGSPAHRPRTGPRTFPAPARQRLRPCSFAPTTLDGSYSLGAYYYYNVQPDRGPKGGPTYEQTLLGVARYAREARIPYRYWLADSWWYAKGAETRGVPRPGVSRWEGMRAVLP